MKRLVLVLAILASFAQAHAEQPLEIEEEAGACYGMSILKFTDGQVHFAKTACEDEAAGKCYVEGKTEAGEFKWDESNCDDIMTEL